MVVTDLDSRQVWRYWVSLCLYLIVIATFIVGFTVGPLILILYIKGGISLIEATWHKSATSTKYAGLAGSCFVIGGIIGAWLGHGLWRLIVVRTGFIDKVTYARLISGRAPTRLQDRTRRSLGYLVYCIFGGFLTYITYQQKGALWAAVPLLILLYLIYLAWQTFLKKE